MAFGSPILTILFVLYLVSTPIGITIQSEINKSDNIFINNPLLSPIFLTNIPTFIITLIILLSIKPLELVSGSIKTIIIIFATYLIDVVIRSILILLNINLNVNGPISVLTCLVFLYSITFPTIKSNMFPTNEKVLLLVLLISTVIFNGAFTFVPILSGFISFAILSPLITSTPKRLKSQ